MNLRNIITRTLFILTIFAGVVCLLSAGAPRAHAAQQRQQRQQVRKASATEYECPMHPEVVSKRPGRCPKCGMNLTAKKEAHAEQPAPAAAPAASAAPKSEDSSAPLSSLNIADASVVDQDGRKLNFYTDLVKGKTVAINFIFTTCTTICPPLTATFRRVQQTLGEGSDVQLISISVDPATDVPERLKAFSSKFKAGPGWTFVTGSKPEIDRLLASLGAAVADRNDHTPMVLIGNDTARFWTRTYGLAPASQLSSLLKEAASKSANSGSSQPQKTGATAEDVAAKYFPNTQLLTQDNKPVRFYDDMLKNKVVLINFLFTTCKGVCSPMTANLARVQKHLGERVGREVNIISISVDPLTDTPAVLKKYADSFHVQPGWYFLTGEKKDVDQVLYKLGGYVEDKQQHSSVLIIGNARTGEWMKVLAMANPAEIAAAVNKLIASKPQTN